MKIVSIKLRQERFCGSFKERRGLFPRVRENDVSAEGKAGGVLD